jgi:hypothetical protein
MKYRFESPKFDPEDPYRHDALNRKDAVDFLAGVIGRVGGPFVLALDAPWGSGKTTLVQLLNMELQKQGFRCVYFNAWQVDYVTDPLVALVASIDLAGPTGATGSLFRQHLKEVRHITGLVAKRGVVALTKALTAGALDLDEEIEAAASEFAGEVTGDLVEAFQKEKELLAKFRHELSSAIEQLPQSGSKPTLVFFVDELDRCRPTFAIELLERIKHLFDVPNIAFVLSIDKSQLEASTAAVYGQGIEAAEYLRRFIDLEFGIPRSSNEKFLSALLNQCGLKEVFSQRQGPVASDQDTFTKVFLGLSGLYDLSLRAMERCITRLCVVMDQTPSNHYLDPILVALLVVLRSKDPELFMQLHRGGASAADVFARLSALPGGKPFVEGQVGLALEGWLLAADENESRLEDRKAELLAMSNDPNRKTNRAERLLATAHQLHNSMRGAPRLSHVAAKVDLAARLRD